MNRVISGSFVPKRPNVAMSDRPCVLQTIWSSNGSARASFDLLTYVIHASWITIIFFFASGSFVESNQLPQTFHQWILGGFLVGVCYNDNCGVSALTQHISGPILNVKDAFNSPESTFFRK